MDITISEETREIIETKVQWNQIREKVAQLAEDYGNPQSETDAVEEIESIFERSLVSSTNQKIYESDGHVI